MVKLNARAAAAFSKGCRGKSVWTGRRGVVLRITTNKTAAVVLWDGRASGDCVPLAAIEFAASLSTEDSHSSGRCISASADQLH